MAFLAMAGITASFAQSGTPWPEADKLFHSDPRWLGADAAYSIDLGQGRVLWMFGDTFVASKPDQTRATAAFVRNTVGIQTGYDPSNATIKFYWRTRSGHPAEIFPSEGKVWLWPTSGFHIGDALILFCDRVAPDSSKDSLGFKLVGWTAFQVANPEKEPSAWDLKKVAGGDGKVLMATAALREDRYVYLLGESNPGHELYLARVSLEGAAEGRLDDVEWWSGSNWQMGPSSRRSLIREGGTEASLQRDPRGNGFLEINSLGFGATDIGMRRAQHLEGPWTSPKSVYHPPESDEPDAFVYAGKSHPELIGADLVLTYVASGNDQRLATDRTIYFPRFVKVDLHRDAPAPAH